MITYKCTTVFNIPSTKSKKWSISHDIDNICTPEPFKNATQLVNRILRNVAAFISALVVGDLAEHAAAVGRELVEHARVDAVVLRALPVALRRGALVQAAVGQLRLLQFRHV